MFVLCRDVARPHPSAPQSFGQQGERRRAQPLRTIWRVYRRQPAFIGSRLPPTIHLPPVVPPPLPHRDHHRGSNGSGYVKACLRQYESCPLRFFYTHVLGIGTASAGTIAIRAHACLHLRIHPTGLRRRGSSASPDLKAVSKDASNAIWKTSAPLHDRSLCRRLSARSRGHHHRGL